MEKLGTSEERQVNVLPEAGKQSTKELNPNNLSSKHKISNFPETLNSIPNERGFKMAKFPHQTVTFILMSKKRHQSLLHSSLQMLIMSISY